LSALKLLSQEDTVQRPALTEWPIWHDDPGHDLQQRGAAVPLRHDLTLARYLQRQQAWRASAVRKFDLSAAAVRASVRVARVGSAFFRRMRPFQRSVALAKNAFELIDNIGSTLSRAHSQFSKTLWGR
jgi:hypothetical protein